MRRKMTIAASLAVAVVAAACGQTASGSGASVVEDDVDAEEQEVEVGDDSADEVPVDDASADEVDADGDAADDAADPDDAGERDHADEGDQEDDFEDAGDSEDAGATDAELGTRDNPLDIGTRIEIADWTVTVTDVNQDAADIVMAENEFNDEPGENEQFVMFTVDATYEGDDSGDAGFDLGWAIVGSEGNTFDDRCGVIPNSLEEQGETFPGGSVSGEVCFAVDADQIEGGTIRIEEFWSFDDTRAFFALS